MEKLNDDFVRKNAILKKGDKIFLILYSDHAKSLETIETLIQNPPILWVAGKKLYENNEKIFMITSGAVRRLHHPEIRLVIRPAIIREIELYTYQGLN